MTHAMNNFFKNLFKSAQTEHSPEQHQHQLQLITATLLVEISKADFEQDEVELKRIHQVLKQHFALNEQETHELIQQAHQHSDKLTSLQHMTRQLNESVSQQDKINIIELMWQIVYADGEKDCYEEHLMRQVSDLLYVSHAHFIQARHKAENNA